VIDDTTFAGTGVYAIDRYDITVRIFRGTRQAFYEAGWQGFRLVYNEVTLSFDLNGGRASPILAFMNTDFNFEPWPVIRGSIPAILIMPWTRPIKTGYVFSHWALIA